jgi:tetratricopeptide (TPR) repeat protein
MTPEVGDVTGRPSRKTATLLPALLLFVALPIAADVIHLKNGGTIVADSWEARGGDLVIRQGSGRIIVPRSEVVRIEADPAHAGGGEGSTTPAAVPAADGAQPPTTSPRSREEILRVIDELKRRIGAYPLTRAENTRQLVALLNQLGAQAHRSRDFDEALARFREALGHDPHNATAQLGLAATYFSQDRDVYARTTLEQAVLEHPDHPDLHALLGDVYYSQERPEDALAAWEKANLLRPSPSLKERIDKLRREHSIDSDYRRSEAVHFTLKYDGERAGPDLGSQILTYLEEQFSVLQSRFSHYPQQPIIVIVYPQRQFYEATQAEANVAGLYDGKIRVPIGGLPQITAEARQVLVHELAHAFIAGKSRGTAPRWLHEGLAQQIEGRITPAAAGASLAREYRSLVDKSGWGQKFTYASALSFVEFLLEREGFNRLVDVLAAMGAGATPEAAFEQVTRYSLGELREAWGEALAGKYLQ